jgi:hypothetical protein
MLAVNGIFDGKHVKITDKITETKKYKDLVLSAISSVVPSNISHREIFLAPTRTNNLRADSIIKVDRIVTLKRKDKIADLGKLSTTELSDFKNILTEMVM